MLAGQHRDKTGTEERLAAFQAQPIAIIAESSGRS